jgi:hypothetical protein
MAELQRVCVPERAVNLASQTRYQRRQRFDVSESGVKVHDARPQDKPAADVSAGQKCLTAFLHRGQHLRIQLIQIALDRLGAEP